MNNQSPIAARLARGSVQLPAAMQVLESTDYSRALQGKFEAFITKANRRVLSDAINHLQDLSSSSDAVQKMVYQGYVSSLSVLMGVN